MAVSVDVTGSPVSNSAYSNLRDLNTGNCAFSSINLTSVSLTQKTSEREKNSGSKSGTAGAAVKTVFTLRRKKNGK
jgi:hypothetical protein